MCISDCGNTTCMGDRGYEEVKQAVTTTLAQAQRMGAPRAIALCHCFAGALEFQVGHWATAEDALRQSIQLYREISAASGEAVPCQRLALAQPAPGHLVQLLATLPHTL